MINNNTLQRMHHLIKGDFSFLRKYGIFLVYALFSLFYIFVLVLVPKSATNLTAVILVFTDPAAMGLFFMGAIVLLEKSQRVDSSIAVTPVRTAEYIASKIVVLAITGVIVGTILFLTSIIATGGYADFSCSAFIVKLIGVFLSSILFSICGMFVAFKSDSLNTFLIGTVPFEIVLFTPAILYLFDVLHSRLWIIHPAVASINIISGVACVWDFISICAWIVLLFPVLKRVVEQKIRSLKSSRL